MAPKKKKLEVEKLPKNAKEADKVKGGMTAGGGGLNDRTDDAMSCSTSRKCCD
jgi:hypothetical protein